MDNPHPILAGICYLGFGLVLLLSAGDGDGSRTYYGYIHSALGFHLGKFLFGIFCLGAGVGLLTGLIS